MTAPASPPANRQRMPSWLDLRLVLGVLLILVSVVVGARVISAADDSVRVWAVNSDLAAGAVLVEADVRPVRVRLFDNAEQYLSTGRSPAGRTLTRDLGAGELLPRGALTARPCGSLVSIPVSAAHLPTPIAKGQRIDVFATPKGGKDAKTEQVLAGATVQSARAPKGGLVSANSEWSITVRVPAAKASAVVHAVRTADIDLAVVEADGDDQDDACNAEQDEGAPTSATPSPSQSGRPR